MSIKKFHEENACGNVYFITKLASISIINLALLKLQNLDIELWSNEF
jgi:hypothetical protein